VPGDGDVTGDVDMLIDGVERGSVTVGVGFSPAAADVATNVDTNVATSAARMELLGM